MLVHSSALFLSLSLSLSLSPSLCVIAVPSPPLVTCADLAGPYSCTPTVSANEWSICCPLEGVWVCCALKILSGDEYYERVLGSTGWDVDHVIPEWHEIQFQLPQCGACGEGCSWGDIQVEDCDPGWRRLRVANPCP